MGKKISFLLFEIKVKEKFLDNVDLSFIDKDNFLYSKKQKFKCKIHDKVFYKYPKTLINSKYICQECQKEQSKTHFYGLNKKPRTYVTVELFLKEVNDKFTNILINTQDICLIKRNGTLVVNYSKAIKCFCKIHGEFYSSPRNLLRSKHGCLKCARDYIYSKNISNGIQRRTTLIPEFIKVHGHQYDYSMVDFNTKLQKIKIICPKHGVFEMYPSLHLRGEGCNLCNVDKLNCERRLGELLKQKFPNIQILQQFHDFLGRQSLDYFLPEYNIGIEYQGSLHFIENTFFKDDRHSLEYCKQLDILKYNKCKEHNIEVIYFTFSKEFKNNNYIGKLFVNINELYSYIETIIFEHQNKIKT